MTNFEKEFYAQLGLLSVQFSKMEYYLTVIVTNLLGTEEELVAVTIIERNNLNQNIELLLKLNKLKDDHDKEITEMASEINKVRSMRNLFIHGIWKDLTQVGNKIQMVCEERKIKYSEEKDTAGRLINRKWSLNRHHVFELQEIKQLKKTIDGIIEKQLKLLEEMERQKYS